MLPFPIKRVRQSLKRVVTTLLKSTSSASAEMFVGEKWAECTECDIWYHTDSCLNVTDELLKGDWECPGCL